MEQHQPSLTGAARDLAEEQSWSTGFFTWAVGKWRKHDYFFQIGAAIDTQFESWIPSGKAH